MPQSQLRLPAQTSFQMGDRVRAQFPPLHSRQDPLADRPHQLKRPFAAQALATWAIVKRWQEARRAAAVAECGIGKTLISLSSVFAHAEGRSSNALAMVSSGKFAKAIGSVAVTSYSCFVEPPRYDMLMLS